MPRTPATPLRRPYSRVRPWLRRACVVAVLALAGCGTAYQPMGPARATPAIDGDELVSIDGARLPLRTWQPARAPWAAIVALHGMNDYSNAFDQAARYWAGLGIVTYAYDQRGFGAGPRPGIWADTATMVADLNAAVEAVSAAHPGLPVYVLGESMGGAVVASALGSPPALGQRAPLSSHIAGAILSAPAMWGRQVMNPFYRFTLWLGYNTVPGMEVEPPRGLKIMPSDNIEMLRALGSDPLVIKRTRIDALKGLVDLMSDAEAALPAIPPNVPLLVLFGRHEQVLPDKVVTETLRRIEDAPVDARPRVALYSDGYHMLLRDLQAEIVWRDIAAWMRAPMVAALPSGAEQHYPTAHATPPAPRAPQAYAGGGAQPVAPH
ncbi:Arylesterase [Bordetella sputigena]|uniref:alpha/beta hydrolase n=1 Tax=Bordetella sputigena TaxID=1416810 RepID=UPI0039F072C4